MSDNNPEVFPNESFVTAPSATTLKGGCPDGQDSVEQLRKRLDEAEQRWHRIMQASNDVIWTYDAAKNGYWFSDRLCLLFGYDKTPSNEISYEAWLELVHPEDKIGVLESIAAAVQRQSAVWEREYRLRRADGTYALVLVRAFAEYDESGRWIRSLGTVTDVSRERTAELRLRESEQRYRMLIDIAAEGIVWFDQEFRIRFVNSYAADVLGYTPEEMIGQPAEGFAHDQDRAAVAEEMRRRRNGDIGRYQLRLQKKDGSTIWVSVSARAFNDNAGRFEGSMCVLTNITDSKAAEEALRLTQERFELVCRATNDAVYDHDIRSNATWLSTSMTEVFGAAMGHHENASWWEESIHPEDRETVLNSYGAALNSSSEHWTSEYRYRRVNGTYAYLLDRGFIIRGRDGQALRVIGAMMDISERKLAEQACAQALNNLNAIFEHAAIGIARLSLQGAIENANPTYCAMLGYSQQELEGMQFLDITHPEDRKRSWVTFLEHAFSGGDTYRMEKRYLHRDGRTIWAKLTVSRVRDAAGHPQFNVAMIEDITAQRSTAEEVQRMAEIVESTSDAVISIARSGEILTWNKGAEKLYAYSAAEAIGSHESLLLPPGKGSRIEQLIARLENGETLQNHETVRLAKSGEERPVSLTISPVRDQNGRITGVSQIARDLTQKRKNELLEEQFRQTQKLEAIGRLAGGVAHDFNNMLMVVMSYSQMLQDRLPPADGLRRYTQQILKSAERAANLTHQLLAFSRKQLLTPEIVELNSVVDETVKMLRRLIGEDIELVFERGECLRLIKADSGQMVQILMNLCVNARDAMPQGGKLTIETRNVALEENYVSKKTFMPPGSYVMLAVSDTGLGMTDEVKERIFEPFFTTKELGKGTGLGLATVYGIVKQSGGFVWCYSEPGQGTTFKVYLPQAEASAKATSAMLEPTPVGNETILLVEDEEALRDSVAEYLRSCGYEVVTAENGAHALDVNAAHAGRIDILVTDVVMPKMSGRELAERLTSLRPGMRTLFMSGYTDEAIIRHGVLEAGLSFIQKPFTLRALAKKLREVMADPVLSLGLRASTPG